MEFLKLLAHFNIKLNNIFIKNFELIHAKRLIKIINKK